MGKVLYSIIRLYRKIRNKFWSRILKMQCERHGGHAGV